MITFIFFALSRFLGNMSETRCTTPVLMPITGEVEVSPAEDMLDNSPSPVKQNILDIKKDFATFSVSFVYYLILFLFKHPIFQKSKSWVLHRMGDQGPYHYYKLRRFCKREDGKKITSPEKSLLLCALAYQFPKKSNTDLLEMLKQKLKPGQMVEFISKKTGPGQNNELFESAAKLAKVGEIQVLVKKTSKVFKFLLDGSNSQKVMHVHCNSDTVKHPSYSLQLDKGQFALFNCPTCECEFDTKDNRRAHVDMCFVQPLSMIGNL